VKQELEFQRLEPGSALGVQEQIQRECTQQTQDWADKLMEKYPRQKVATALREAAEEVEQQ